MTIRANPPIDKRATPSERPPTIAQNAGPVHQGDPPTPKSPVRASRKLAGRRAPRKARECSEWPLASATVGSD